MLTQTQFIILVVGFSFLPFGFVLFCGVWNLTRAWAVSHKRLTPELYPVPECIILECDSNQFPQP